MSNEPARPAGAPAEVMPAVGSPKSRPNTDVHEVAFVSYPKLLFVWPLILAGLLFWPIAYWGGDGVLESLGWVYIMVALFIVLTLGVDVDRNQAVFWAVLILMLLIFAVWLRDAHSMPVLGWIGRFFDGFDVRYDKGLGLAISFVLLVPYVVMIFWARMNDRWRITHNEFEHYSFGRKDDALGRGAKTIRTEFPDFFELLLGGAGTLIVFNATGQQELRRIPHVLFLPHVRKKLNKVLERTAVTTAAATEEDES